jgi:sugar lactone lactonase YvrE
MNHIRILTIAALLMGASCSKSTAPAQVTSNVVPENAEVKKIATGYTFTEGVTEAVDGRVFFSDIPNNRIHIFDPKTSQTTVHRENTGGANGLMFNKDGVLFACEGNAKRVTKQIGSEVTVLADKFEGKALNSPNDLALDNAGGVYFTDPGYGLEPPDLNVEAVYYVSAAGEVTRAISDLNRPNGIVFSPDFKVLYVADVGDKKIFAYDVISSGKPENKRQFTKFGADGMTVDEMGNLYTTAKGKVTIVKPDGKVAGVVTVPESPTNVEFGGKDGKTLFITARTSLYAVDLNARGVDRQKRP